MDENRRSACGAAAWVELAVPDLRAAAQFYGALLGWGFAEVADASEPYLMATSQRLPVAGLLQPDQDHYDVLWTVYLETRDVAATMDAAIDLGASVLIPPLRVVDFGRLVEEVPDAASAVMPWYFPASDLGELATMAVLADPSGCSIGLWHWRGGSIDSHHAATGHVAGAEHLSIDPHAAAAFYRSVPGWEDAAGKGVAFHRAPEGLTDLAPLWVPCFAVANVEATAKRAIDLGGTRTTHAGLPSGTALITGPWGEPVGLAAAESAPPAGAHPTGGQHP